MNNEYFNLIAGIVCLLSGLFLYIRKTETQPKDKKNFWSYSLKTQIHRKYIGIVFFAFFGIYLIYRFFKG